MTNFKRIRISEDFFGSSDSVSDGDNSALKGASPRDDEVYPVATPSADGGAEEKQPVSAAPSDDLGGFEPDDEEEMGVVDTKGLDLGEEGELPREFRTPSNKYTIVDESEVDAFDPDSVPLPGASCFSLTYDLKPKYVEADIDDIARAQDVYSHKFDCFLASEIISLNASRGVVSLWMGKNDSTADREATIQQMRSFIADDPFIIKNLVEDYTIMDLSPGATEAEFRSLNSHKDQAASEAALAREGLRASSASSAGATEGDEAEAPAGTTARPSGSRDFLRLEDIPEELRCLFDEDLDG
jgi:hypothetical protein